MTSMSTMPNTQQQQPAPSAVVVSSTNSPPQSSNDKELIASKVPEASRNDDSNPQQGTGAPTPTGTLPTGTKSEVSTPPPHPAMMPRVMPQRPSLKIPPTTKDDRKLFVGGLPSDVTDEEFSTFFSQFGKVMDSIVMFDYGTGRSRGFGFVTYEDPNVARHLLSLGHEHNKGPGPHSTGRIQMRDKLVEIKAAQPKEGRRGPRGGGRRKPLDETATLVPDAFAVEDPSAYAYAVPPMPHYGYPAPVYGAPVYAPAPYPAGFVQGYVAPVFYPHEAAAPIVVPEPQPPQTPFAGYAFIPFVPPPAGSPEQQ